MGHSGLTPLRRLDGGKAGPDSQRMERNVERELPTASRSDRLVLPTAPPPSTTAKGVLGSKAHSADESSLPQHATPRHAPVDVADAPNAATSTQRGVPDRSRLWTPYALIHATSALAVCACLVAPRLQKALRAA